MEVKPFTLVLEVFVPESKIKEVESWNELITWLEDIGFRVEVEVIDKDN